MYTLVIDFETEDSGEFGPPEVDLPEVLPLSKLKRPEELLDGTLGQIKAYIGGQAALDKPDEYWDQLLQFEREAQARSGALTLIQAGANARQAVVDKAISKAKYALDPELCTVVAMGWAVDDQPTQSMVGRHGKEVELLSVAWDIVANANTVVGYNIINFDTKVLLSRSMKLGIEPSRTFDLNPWQDPWKGSDFVDIMVRRFGRERAKSLKLLAEHLGIEVPEEGVDGSQVASLTDEELTSYVESDVIVTRRIYEMGAGFYWPLPNYISEQDIPF